MIGKVIENLSKISYSNNKTYILFCRFVFAKEKLSEENLFHTFAIIIYNMLYPMKRIIMFVCALIAALTSYATAQQANVIYIDGVRWAMFEEPLISDSVLYTRMMDLLPKERSRSTANWEGYTSYWSLKKRKLCLDSIRVGLYNKETQETWFMNIPQSDMRKLFKDYLRKGRIVASWFNGEIRVGRGQLVRYRHLAYDRNHENEIFFMFSRGRVKAKEEWQNRLIDGYSFTSLRYQMKPEEVRTLLPLHPERFPELDNVKEVSFSVVINEVDSLGRIADCKVSSRIWIDDKHQAKSISHQGIEEEMKQRIMAVHPWKTTYLYGKYSPFEKADAFLYVFGK